MTHIEPPPNPRDWENWPGRAAASDDRPRRGLRALFVPSDETIDPIEELIEARGRELEARAGELRETLAELGAREDRVRSLRATVETLLREGSAELDERHAEVARAANELTVRQERLALDEARLEERRAEAGAVELRRAAVERAEAAVTARQEELEELAAELRRRADDLAARETLVESSTPAAVDETAHILVLPAHEGYRLIEREGPAPALGDSVTVDGTDYETARTGRSPLPADRRRCSFLARRR